MMRKLKIEVLDEHGRVWKKVICVHVDSTKNITVLSECEIKIGVDQLDTTELIIPEKIDHFNIYEGMITIYYQCGKTIEITRFND